MNSINILIRLTIGTTKWDASRDFEYEYEITKYTRQSSNLETFSTGRCARKTEI